jgi:hypothetical protein
VALLVASLYDQVFLRQLPIPEPRKLVLIEKTSLFEGRIRPYGGFSRHECQELRRGASPLGRHISTRQHRGDWSRVEPGDLTVVGVVADHALSDVRETHTPRAYLLAGDDQRSVQVYLRTAAPPAAVAVAARRILRTLPEAALGDIHSLDRQRDLILGSQRLASRLSPPSD